MVSSKQTLRSPRSLTQNGVIAIETLSLVKRYGSVSALDGLSLAVPRGEIFGFLGPNGAGKTTAVKILLGLTRPTTGEGALLGAPFGDLRTRRRIGYLPELFRYQDWLTAREVLTLHCRLMYLPRSQHSTQVEHILKLVGLTDRGDHRVGGFSKGMQQRLGLGVALLGEPELVILDEPTSALDPVGRYDVREIISVLKQRGTTVFLNSHLLTEVEKVCDRVAIVDHGRIVEVGQLDQLLRGDLVRLRLTSPLPPEVSVLLAHYGSAAQKDGWITVSGMDPERIPDLVKQLVEIGAGVMAVEQHRNTLEERFLEALDEDA